VTEHALWPVLPLQEQLAPWLPMFIGLAKFILRKTRDDANGRRCVVVWRSPEEIGIKFLNSESAGDL
jgi:hypothetical protein